jgi:hypothetical protein
MPGCTIIVRHDVSTSAFAIIGLKYPEQYHDRALFPYYIPRHGNYKEKIVEKYGSFPPSPSRPSRVRARSPSRQGSVRKIGGIDSRRVIWFVAVISSYQGKVVLSAVIGQTGPIILMQRPAEARRTSAAGHRILLTHYAPRPKIDRQVGHCLISLATGLLGGLAAVGLGAGGGRGVKSLLTTEANAGPELSRRFG